MKFKSQELLAAPDLVQIPSSVSCQVSRVLHAGANKNLVKETHTAHHKNSKLDDQLILKAVELKGRDWRAVLAFLKRNFKSFLSLNLHAKFDPSNVRTRVINAQPGILKQWCT